MTHTIHHGDCLDVLRGMPDNSVSKYRPLNIPVTKSLADYERECAMVTSAHNGGYTR